MLGRLRLLKGRNLDSELLLGARCLLIDVLLSDLLSNSTLNDINPTWNVESVNNGTLILNNATSSTRFTHTVSPYGFAQGKIHDS